MLKQCTEEAPEEIPKKKQLETYKELSKRVVHQIVMNGEGIIMECYFQCREIMQMKSKVTLPLLHFQKGFSRWQDQAQL
jgi:hypothetical protein